MADEERIVNADKALERYYKQQDTEYFDNDGKGKFAAWADDNGFDAEGIDDEFEVDPDESVLLDVDPDFPGKHLTSVQIIAIIQRCWTERDAYTNEVPPLQVTANDWFIEDKELQTTIKRYGKQCPALFDGGMKGDQAIIRVFTVGDKLDAPYLQFLADMFTRDRLSGNDPTLSPSKWVLQNKHMQELKAFKAGKSDSDPYQQALSAIISFFHRIVPKLMLNTSNQIVDSIEQTARYITASVEFVSQLANQPQLSCPFQVDTCIVFNETKDSSVMQKINFSDDDDDNDDDDDDDDDDDTGDEKGNDAGFGNIKEKLKAEKLPHLASKVNTALNEDKSGVRTARMFMDPYVKFKDNQINEKYKKDKAVREQYPRKHRFVSLIDKRKPNKENGTEAEDEIIFFEPPDNCNVFPDGDGRGHVPLWYFNSSRTCIVPNIGYEHGKHLKDVNNRFKSKDNNVSNEAINSSSPCNGSFITLSFHVESENEIRAYLFINGQMARFLADDIINVLPKFFDPKFGKNKGFAESKAAKALVSRIKPKLRDVQFEAFYNEYRNKS